MRVEYIADEFVGMNAEPTTIENEVEKKISVLYDMYILRNHDAREEAVRKLLLSYETPMRMDNAIHDVIVGNYTLNEWLKRKGVA